MLINKSNIAFGTKASMTKGTENLVRRLYGEENAAALKKALSSLSENGCNYDTLKISTESAKTANTRKVPNRQIEIKGSRNLRLRYERINSIAKVNVDESFPISILRNLFKTPESIEIFIKDLYSRHSRGNSYLFSTNSIKRK